MVVGCKVRWLFAGAALVLLLVGCGGESQRERPQETVRGGNVGTSGVAAGGASGADTTGGRNSAGSPAAGESGNGANGGTAGTSGAAGGVSVAGSGAGGADAAGGAAGEPDEGEKPLVPCNSSDGSGCDADSVCADRLDVCLPAPDTICDGYCAARLPVRTCEGSDPTAPCPDGYICVPGPSTSSGDAPTSTCVESPTACESNDDCPTGFSCVSKDGAGLCAPDRVSCAGPVTCPAIAAACPSGYVRSTPDGCFGPCVRVEHCTCEDDYQCLAGPAVCDRSQGTCAIPKAPAPRCRVPFDPDSSCGNPVSTRYAFLDGRCEEVSTEPCGQDNEFLTLEECRTYCAGTPIEEPCADGFVHVTVCIACGAGGGCAQIVEICARQCSVQEDCSAGAQCVEGVCQVVGCV